MSQPHIFKFIDVSTSLKLVLEGHRRNLIGARRKARMGIEGVYLLFYTCIHSLNFFNCVTVGKFKAMNGKKHVSGTTSL